MRIIIDLQGAQTESRFRGIGRYSLSITKAILRNNTEHEIYILLNGLFPTTLQPIKDELNGLISSENIFTAHYPGPVRAIDEGNEWRQQAAYLLREDLIQRLDADLIFITSLFEGHVDDAVLSIKKLHGKVITSVLHHDLIPLVNKETYLCDSKYRDYYMEKIDFLKRADLILTNSHYTSDEARKYLSDSGAVFSAISSATEDDWVDKNITSTSAEIIKNKFAIEKEFILYAPGGFDQRKNFNRLIAAYAELEYSLRSIHQLVIVSKLNKNDEIYLKNIIKNHGLDGSEVILTGYVSDDELILLYRNCYLFVFASEHEGFGLPILEAMKCGAATIGSNVTSIPEVIGLKEALFDPFNVMSITGKLREAINDKKFYGMLKKHAVEQAEKFSWDKSAQKAIFEFENIYLKKGVSVSSVLDPNQLIEEIIEVKSTSQPNDEDFIMVAEALDRNIKLAQLVSITSQPVIWQVDGPFDSSYSLALVNREFARGLASSSNTDVLLHSTEGPGDFEPNAEYLNLESNQDLSAWHKRTKNNENAILHVQSRNIYPPRVTNMHGEIKLLHSYAWEETGYPREWIVNFNNELDAVLCTSHHVKKVLIDNGLSIPALVTGNGCDHWENIISEPHVLKNARGMRFLHVSSCFPRKGIDALLTAYGMAFSAKDDVSLIIKTFENPHNTVRKTLKHLQENNTEFPHVIIIEEDLSEPKLKSLYEQCDVLVAPGCAEGFGLPIAEAMLSGVPSIVTGWSGQMDFCNAENSWLVNYEFSHAKTHFGLYASAWANVNIADLVDKMRIAANTDKPTLKSMALSGRERLLSVFSWHAVAQRSISGLNQLRNKAWELNQRAKIGWITTWNTKCGIATYSQHLIHNMPVKDISIFAPANQELLSRSGDTALRTWQVGKDQNDFALTLEKIKNSAINTVVIQFNYGFYNHTELSDLIKELKNADITVVMTMHSTTDPDKTPHENFKLSAIKDALLLCDRLLVHTIKDMNQLKKIGLIQNVTLLPHGVLHLVSEDSEKLVRKNDIPVVATYGFCLPHKGLKEILHSVKLLRDKKTPVKLMLVNAEFPAEESHQLVKELKSFVKQNELQDLVSFHNDFLSDNESFNLLNTADLLLFAYQNTEESASGAVRYGMATSRPVLVTPIAIFDDLGDSVFKFSGTTVEDIANGISSTLRMILNNDPVYQNTQTAAAAWREQHDYRDIGHRLENICTGIVRNKNISDEY